MLSPLVNNQKEAIIDQLTKENEIAIILILLLSAVCLISLILLQNSKRKRKYYMRKYFEILNTETI